MGSPKGCEPYGDRVPVVVAGVTTCQGGREGRPQGEGAQVIGYYDRKACAMQSAETVLGVLRDRGRKGLPCNELYRQMFNRDLYLLAYGRIYANQGRPESPRCGIRVTWPGSWKRSTVTTRAGKGITRSSC